MRLSRTLTGCLSAIALTIGCTKNDSPSTAVPDPVIPDFGPKVTTTLTGYVTDTTGAPVAGATLAVGSKQATSNAAGYFSLTNVSVPKIAGVVSASKSAFFKAYTSFVPRSGKESFVQVRLLKKSEWAQLNAQSGGEAQVGSLRFSLPGNSLVKADGSAYSGTVYIYARQISYADETGAGSVMPGDARGTDGNGYLTLLQSFGTLAMELNGSSGETLQLAAGKKMTVTIPIPAELNATAPLKISVWSFDAGTGFWQEESLAPKTEESYVATLSHASYWNAALGFPTVSMTVRFVDDQGKPLVHAPLTITPISMPAHSLYGRFGFTDTDGYATGNVFSNANLMVNVLATDADAFYSHPFKTSSNAIDLLTLTVK
ncbi:MAG: carboxypeptidase-like regulatory domain-containing protein [Candidatus Pseudobacter hemicellulosilyticus]|uniref:Carboxypeptidase-like regulatory domain-containing protein n=1 Tax=Candidatus Pseudobacter hemicellulosilyticus TaxID=3121375 RepID=A0AAJ5WTE2_9BACT|nr:MAG: carboxypeptidase-like regulatory domain-containing protein [Pseudobacter sp.]